MKKAFWTILLILVFDQASKIWVKTNMFYNETIPVFGKWFLIHFIENPGMAFGMEFGGEVGKLLLSIFRIAAVIALFWGLNRSVKRHAPNGFIISLSLIIAGAIGNIIDSMFYGLIFSESTHVGTADFFPASGGYAGFMHGNVVDMLHFPLIEGRFPEWMPIWGGEPFMFFRPVFNVADSAITIGILMIILRQKHYLGHEDQQRSPREEPRENALSGEGSETSKASRNDPV